MHKFQPALDTAYAADFARSFQYRPWLKGALLAAGAILVMIVFAYLLPALQQLSAAAGRGRWKLMVVSLAGFLAFSASVGSALQALLSWQRLTGYQLMIHVAAAPVFALSAVLVVLFWAGRNSFDRADWNRLCHPLASARTPAITSRLVLARKVFFWTAAAASIPTLASATLALFPVLPSVRQETLFMVHRYSVAPLAASVLLFTLLALACTMRRGTDRARSDAPVAAATVGPPG
jgi:hypothetical protein